MFRRWRSRPINCGGRIQPTVPFISTGSADRYSVRIGDHHRALGKVKDGTIVWIWIGTHSEYDRLVNRY
jgi:hypothetical protein